MSILEPTPLLPGTSFIPELSSLRFLATFKQIAEDFVVEEIPAYEPIGEGDHLYLWIEKKNLSAEQLQQHLARSLRIRREDIGMAGLKDKKAITRQYVSVPALRADRIEEVESEFVHVLRSSRHRNKLKTGHLLGNRFEILLRTSQSDAFSNAEKIAIHLRELGVPNYYGEQRFGHENETLILGYGLLSGEKTQEDIPYARRRFLLRFALSSVQSNLFNATVLERLQSGRLHKVLSGDVMQKRDSGGVFTDENNEILQARFDSKEIVMTGPMFGPKMLSPQGEALQLEQSILQAHGVDRDCFREYGKLTLGTRRAVLTFPQELTVSEDPEGVRLSFSLPPGNYATVVLNEFLAPVSLEDSHEAVSEDLSSEEDSPVSIPHEG